jgi:transcriptional regulator GlxA family with amidase domain
MRKISVGMLLFPGFQLLDIAGPRDAFAEVKVLSRGECLYDVMTVATTRNSIASSSGMTVVADRTIFDPCPHFDTLIVPGGLGVFDVMHDSTVSTWLKAQGRDCRRLAAICNGVFAVGAAGFLDGRTVSTHWMDAAHLARTFPQCRVEPDRIYVKDQQLYTTAGVTAGIDLALVMIEEDHGRTMALDVAKYLIVYLRRAGGQSQFSPLLEMQAVQGSTIETAQRLLLDQLHKPHTLESLAAQVNMSARNLSRVFMRECGVAPMAFLNNARIDAARRLLEGSDLPLKEIAQRCGFDTPEALRRAFRRSLQLTPPEYRQRFRSQG